MTTAIPVVNRHHYRDQLPLGAIYIGRPGKIAQVEIARGAADGTALGNMYTAREHGEAAIGLYRAWLLRVLRGEASGPAGRARAAMAAISGSSLLLCSCAPRPCHGDVIASAWAWMHGQATYRRDPIVGQQLTLAGGRAG